MLWSLWLLPCTAPLLLAEAILNTMQEIFLPGFQQHILQKHEGFLLLSNSQAPAIALIRFVFLHLQATEWLEIFLQIPGNTAAPGLHVFAAELFLTAISYTGLW